MTTSQASQANTTNTMTEAMKRAAASDDVLTPHEQADMEAAFHRELATSQAKKDKVVIKPGESQLAKDNASKEIARLQASRKEIRKLIDRSVEIYNQHHAAIRAYMAAEAMANEMESKPAMNCALTDEGMLIELGPEEVEPDGVVKPKDPQPNTESHTNSHNRRSFSHKPDAPKQAHQTS